MNRIFFFIAFLIISTYLQAQNSDNYRSSVKDFYRLIFSDKKITVDDFKKVYSNASSSYEAEMSIKKGIRGKAANEIQLEREIREHSDTLTSLVLLELRNYKDQLTQGLDYSTIIKMVDSAPTLSEGLPFSVLLKLTFPHDISVYFQINNTTEPIENIWLPTGESLSLIIEGYYNTEKLQLPGTINDGYTDIRKESEKESPIVGKLMRDEIFYYTPVSGKDWWPVYKKEGGEQIGYIQKNKILKYSDLPKTLKDKVDQQRLKG